MEAGMGIPGRVTTPCKFVQVGLGGSWGAVGGTKHLGSPHVPCRRGAQGWGGGEIRDPVGGAVQCLGVEFGVRGVLGCWGPPC